MQRKAVVVGAGPVGCLAAMALANQGWQVVMYESRPGMMSTPLVTDLRTDEMKSLYGYNS
jgi:kynurenine 3-monooxygenase